MNPTVAHRPDPTLLTRPRQKYRSGLHARGVAFAVIETGEICSGGIMG